MLRSSGEFRRLLRLLEEQHERDLAGLKDEISRFGTEKCEASTLTSAPTIPSLKRTAVAIDGTTAPLFESDVNSITLHVAEQPALNAISFADVEADRSSPQHKASDVSLPPDSANIVEPFVPTNDSAPSTGCRVSAHSSVVESSVVDPKVPACQTPQSKFSTYSSVSHFTNSDRQRFKLLPGWVDRTKSAGGKLRTSRTVSSRKTSTSSAESGYNMTFYPARHCHCVASIEGLCLPRMINPHNKARIAWSVFSLVIVCYEVLIVPPECFIGFQPNLFTIIMKWMCRVFWTLDLPLQFMTGISSERGLELRPSIIWYRYMRTWFVFDLLLVVTDWLFLGSQGCGSTSLRPVLRAFRLLRMLRVLQIANLNQLIGDLMTVAPDMVVGCAGLLKITIVICVLVHFFACFRFTLEAFWAPTSTSTSFMLKYRRAVYWTILDIHGTSPVDPHGTIGYAFPILMAGFGFFTMALFVGKTSHTIMVLSYSRRTEMHQICRKYLRARKVSAQLQIRLNKYLARSHLKSFKDEREHETDMIKSLPECLQTALHMEIRRPLLLQMYYFRELSPRMLRMLCFEAISSVVAVRPERVFERDFVATRMLWVESGILSYSLLPQPVSRGACLCEAALWTNWFHCGELVALSNVTMLSLGVSKFMLVVAKMDTCVAMTLNYARQYITQLNKHMTGGERLSDILDFESNISKIREPSTSCVHFEHLVFLTHFKQEAGTEAALMSEELEKKIQDDESHPFSAFVSPCFLDSDGLVALSELTYHVENSHNLMVLLTPQILSRAWCLVEIVTAVRSNVNLVPVEIQRPGLQFQYPDEQFYEALTRGETLTKDALSFLAESGIELDELSCCVREVFMKIALPFSPHKSTKVRHAELCDILNRCIIRGEEEFEDAQTLNITVAKTSEYTRTTQTATRSANRAYTGSISSKVLEIPSRESQISSI